MKKRARFNIIFMAVLILSLPLILGCAKVPTEEMTKAENAVAEAKQKEADLYVSDVFMQAEESLKKAKDLVTLKKYKEAKSAAEETVMLSEKAISLVEQNKAEMKSVAEDMVETITKGLDELKTSVAAAIKKKAAINREEVQGTLGKLEIDFVGAKEKLEALQIRQAYDELKAIEDKINTEKEGIDALL